MLIEGINDDAGQRHSSSDLLGGGMGFRCYEMSSGRKSVDVRLEVGQSVGGRSMTSTVYDVGLRGRLGGSLLVPTIGIGFLLATIMWESLGRGASMLRPAA